MTDPFAPFDNFSRRSPWKTVTRWLIVINILVFLIDQLFLFKGLARYVTTSSGQFVPEGYDKAGNIVLAWQPMLTSFLYFSVDKAIIAGQVWRFFTYQFTHANLEHIALNMFGLLMAGPLVESIMGRRRFLLFYLVCGAAGPAAHIGLSLLGVLSMNTITPLVGASASIYGVLVAAARIAPNEVVMLAFPPIDLKLRNFAMIVVGLSVAAVLFRWQNAGGHAAHIGGAVAGYFLSRRFAEKRLTPFM
ncbi:MAG: rhomboid family intramembrane serine protease [Tepidisphaeraceae bacterium]